MSDPTRDDRRPTRPLLVADLPAPPYPSGAKARGWRFEIDTEQLFASSTWRLALTAGGDVANALLRMWVESWAQVPAGSMPNDEREIAAIIGVPLMGFQAHRDIFFRHWQACSDGRLYHDTIGKQIGRLFETRLIDRRRKSLRNPAESKGIQRSPRESAGIPPPEPEPEPIKPNPLSGSQANQDGALAILDFLNRKAGRHFRPTPATLKPIIARLKEGNTVSDCKAMIAHRWRAWKDRPDMVGYMRPETLFGEKKFAQYMGDVPTDDDEEPNANPDLPGVL